MFIIKNKIFFLLVSLVVVVVSLFALYSYGLKYSIDFTGGTRAKVSYENPVLAESIQTALSSRFQNTKVVAVSAGSPNTFKITTENLDETGYNNSIEILNSQGKNTLQEITTIGPSISKEVTQKAILGFILVAICIIIFITITFWGVARPVASFKYGLITIIALAHDTIIPAGVFAYLGYTQGVEVDSLFVVALLTILGVSVSDTIVVFDRIRENLKVLKGKTFEEIVGISLEQSFARSLATSVSVIAVLLALYWYGPASTKYFALTLTIGMFVGTYSSIFVASPLLVLTGKYWKGKEN